MVAEFDIDKILATWRQRYGFDLRIASQKAPETPPAPKTETPIAPRAARPVRPIYRRPLGPRQYSPYDNSLAALRSRNGRVNSPVLGGTFGPGYYGGRDRMVPPGGRRIYDHDDPNAPYGATRWRNPNATGNYGGVYKRPEHR